MSYETWNIVQNKEVDGIELQMALQCAPLITGWKISNLLNIRAEDYAAVKKIVKNSHISWYLILEREDKMTILLYHRKSLENYLAQKTLIQLLSCGVSMRDIIDIYCSRMSTKLLRLESSLHSYNNYFLK